MKRLLALLALAALAACSRAVPDPRDAARVYAEAATRGDVDALYAMMTPASQKERTRDDFRRMVTETRSELAEQATAIMSPEARIEALAKFRFADGEEVALDLHAGRYGMAASGALPGGGRTPAQTLDQLRRVLARRSYAGLLRVLTPATRTAIEQDLRNLVEGLERSETLSVQVSGETATVAVPGGHHVRLRRDGAIWRVETFD